ncbi:MAG TPA: hypothetical protein VK118_00195 [Tetragenococcus sp.]|nr:hypothetical protein [Tetragenococcus sp.]
MFYKEKVAVRIFGGGVDVVRILTTMIEKIMNGIIGLCNEENPILLARDWQKVDSLYERNLFCFPI